MYVFRTEALRAALAERPAATSLQQARTEPVKTADVCWVPSELALAESDGNLSDIACLVYQALAV